MRGIKSRDMLSWGSQADCRGRNACFGGGKRAQETGGRGRKDSWGGSGRPAHGCAVIAKAHFTSARFPTMIA